ncbi:hypothetical protein TWF970_009785 [Orbilia oligospora]|uniref:Uncharacterized protein n=1 Tax=Orbilia oligospora TaxID=2813651 RepID=A0A7C8VKM4_ORBOL|nr:hypothetical protein TWF970_009785 [Orbilia oligospora]
MLLCHKAGSMIWDSSTAAICLHLPRQSSFMSLPDIDSSTPDLSEILFFPDCSNEGELGKLLLVWGPGFKMTKTSRRLFQEEIKAGVFAVRFIGSSKEAKKKGQDDHYDVYIVGFDNRFLGY